MGWSGRFTVEARPAAGYVRLGDTLVPRKVTFTFAGDDDTPDLAARFEVRDGRPGCVEIRVIAKKNGRGVRTADLVTFNVDALIVNAFRGLAQRETGHTGAGYAVWGDVWARETENRAAQNDLYEARQRSRGTVTTAVLEDVARVYRENADTAPTKAVEEFFGYSARTAARRVGQARTAGLLPPTTPGRKRI
jgi:hypothetical protein